MKKRTLGRTGHQSAVVTFGTAGLSRVTQESADQAVQLVLSHGVNHMDIAPTYGEAMERMSPWMPKIREKMFLGAKTGQRSRDQAWENINDCRRRLGVEAFDLFQLHAVISMEDLDQVTAPGGALEALVEMREQGLTKWIGITGHGPEMPRVLLEALHRFDFDTIMFPVSASIFRNPEYRKDAEELLEFANAKNVGVQTIKMIARGGWGPQQLPNVGAGDLVYPPPAPPGEDIRLELPLNLVARSQLREMVGGKSLVDILEYPLSRCRPFFATRLERLRSRIDAMLQLL